MTGGNQLLFRDVDGVALAAARGALHDANFFNAYSAQRIGPLFELLQLFSGARVPNPRKWIVKGDLSSMIAALEQAGESWFEPANHSVGFIRTRRCGLSDDSKLTDFMMKAKRAGQDISKFPASTSGELVAAMRELENNIHEHANALETGIIAYHAETGVFEFIASDCGIGILKSLTNCPEHADLFDEGRALEMALKEGVSRYGAGNKRGYGFRPIFTGLVNLHSELRFRSGNYAIVMDGLNLKIPTSRIAQKARIDGFFASVRCENSLASAEA